MAAPISNFSASISLLSVVFTDTSSNTPTSWAWEFGDGSTSVLQNPTHIYATAGSYQVKLTVSNLDGSDVKLVTYVLSATSVIFPLSLSSLIDSKIPQSISVDESYKVSQIIYWQYYLQSLWNPVKDINTITDESVYNPLEMMLLASLAAYQITLDLLEQAAAIAAGMSSGNSGGTVNQTGAGGLKKIVTGPSQVEWYDATSGSASYFNSTVGNTVGGQFTGPLGALLQSICMMASRLNIDLPMCPPIKRKTIIPIKALGRKIFTDITSPGQIIPPNIAT